MPFAGDLDDILCEERTVSNDSTVSNDNTVRYKGRCLQLPTDRHHYVKARVRVTSTALSPSSTDASPVTAATANPSTPARLRDPL